MEQIWSLFSAAKSFKDLVVVPVQGVINLTRGAVNIGTLHAQKNPELLETAKKTLSTANNIFSGLNNLFQLLPFATISTSVGCSIFHTTGAAYEKKLIEGRVKELKRFAKLPMFTEHGRQRLKEAESTLAMRQYALYASATMTALVVAKLLGTNTDFEVVDFAPLNWAITGMGVVNSAFFLHFNQDLIIEKVSGFFQQKN